MPAREDNNQPTLFDTRPAPPQLPEGFKYQPDLITPEEEHELVTHVQTLPFKEFDFHGFAGKRRVVSFGWRYDFTDRELQQADDIPQFLLPLRQRAADFARLDPAGLRHVLVTEYAPGAAIGWHRDKAVFDQVVGVSLLSPCPFRLRRRRLANSKWQRAAITAHPRSAYLLAGPVRTQWEHSIPPIQHLRYSITFRNLLDDRHRNNNLPPRPLTQPRSGDKK